MEPKLVLKEMTKLKRGLILIEIKREVSLEQDPTHLNFYL